MHVCEQLRGLFVDGKYDFPPVIERRIAKSGRVDFEANHVAFDNHSDHSVTEQVSELLADMQLDVKVMGEESQLVLSEQLEE